MRRRRNLAPATLFLFIASTTLAQSPLPPAAELTTFQLDPGLQAELVAAEPQVQSPVAIAFDESANLFVVEMLDYPNGPKPGEPPASRIRKLEDRDGDGRYEHATLFADQLLFANGLLPWQGGMIVTAAPHILYLKDTNGDGRADHREVLWQGFAESNPQLRVSHPILGLDGWVYVANGLRGGKVHHPGAPESDAIDLGGRDFRFDPRNPSHGQATSGMGQFGNTFDDFGRRFVCTNRNHLIPILYPDHLVKPNPNLPPSPPPTDNQDAGGAARIFPISRNFTTSSLHSGSFSASCGITAYRGDALGQNYQASIFTCDPTGNLVHQEILEPEAAGFRWHPPRDGVEFLASTDDWFRPVSLAQGPDGALYVVDMYRAVIEHPEWMPPELKNRPDLHEGANMGRIWRIRQSQPNSSQPAGKLSGMSPAKLTSELESPNGWRRQTAFRLLLENGGTAPLKPLRNLITESQVPEAVVAAAWLLSDLDALDPSTLGTALQNHADPRVREQIPRLLTARATKLPDRSLSLLDTLARTDPDPRVRYNTALALSWADDAPNIERLAAIARFGINDPWTRRAVLNAAADRELSLLLNLTSTDELFRQDNPGDRAIWTETARLIGLRGQPTELSALAELLQERPIPDLWRIRALAAAADGLATKGTSLREVLSDPTLSSDSRSRAAAAWVLDFPRQSIRHLTNTLSHEQDRIDSVRLLSLLPPAEARPALVAVLRDAADTTTQLTAARTLSANFSDADVGDDLLSVWDDAGPSLRRGLAALLAARPDRASRLLDAVEAGSVAAADLDLTLVRNLVDNGPDATRTRARSVLASRLPADRSSVLNRYRLTLSQPGDIDRGRTVFGRACATCHRIGDLGTAVGPDISDTRTKTAEMLLNDILDPNSAIDANYVVYNAATRDGRITSGLIASESAEAILLRQAEGRDEILPRNNLEDLQSTGKSLMPEGLENDISPGEMADLLTFLKKGRYRDAGVPLPAVAP